MLTMSQINHIKDLSNYGYWITEISKKTGADPKMIQETLAQAALYRSKIKLAGNKGGKTVIQSSPNEAVKNRKLSRQI